MNLGVRPEFEVLYENEHCVIVDKPAPLIVHPANHSDEPTLIGGVQQLLAYELANGMSLGVMTRLDRETSGVVLIAKGIQAARYFGKLLETQQVKKEYLAVVLGKPHWQETLCNAALLRAGEVETSDIWVRQKVHPLGKPCESTFQLVETKEREGRFYALVRCFPKSGRMHQLRVHLAHLGHPIVGDKIYSTDGKTYLDWMQTGWTEALQKQLQLSRHALHASKLTLAMPNGEVICIESTLSHELNAFWQGQMIDEFQDLIIWEKSNASIP